MQLRGVSAGIKTSWIGLALFMVVLTVATLLVLAGQQQRLIEVARDNAEDDMLFVSSLLHGELKRQDYQRLGELVESWGRQIRSTYEMKVSAANGFVLGHYVRDRPVEHPYPMQREVRYSYRGRATIELTKDLGAAYTSIYRLRLELFAGLVVVGIGLSLMYVRNRQKLHEAAVLDAANQRLQESARQLRATRANLRNVFDAMPSILVGVDANGCIEMWNSRAESASGKTLEAVRGRAFTEVFPEYAVHNDELGQAIEAGRPLRIERHTAPTKEGLRYSEIVVAPLSQLEVRGAVIRVDDITQRVQLEQMMVQTEKMMSVGGMAAGMAHEINNPLSGVLQSSQNIQRRLSPDLPANRRIAEELGVDLDAMQAFLQRRNIPEFIEGIRDAAERASRIVADMLAFSRRSTSEFAPVSINELLETVVRIAQNDYDLKKTYDFKRIRILRNLDPGLPAVTCDQTQIEQVLLNLIKNAAHAVAGYDAAVDHQIELRTSVDGDCVKIEVADSGPGMSEQTKRRIFEPFYTTKPIGVGTGLGLSVSYYIVTEQHKGTISVDSSPGNGATFDIRLPMSDRKCDARADR